jgi:putative endonuclease
VRHVEIPRSTIYPHQEYFGATADLKRRFANYNAGKSSHTANSCRGNCSGTAVSRTSNALAFEKNLKSHSGRAFAKNRL